MRSRTELAALALALWLQGCTESGPEVRPPAPPPAVVQPQATTPAEVDAGAAAPEGAASATVLGLEGVAQVRREGSEEWLELKVGDAVRVGDQVRTPGDGSVELSFDVARIKVHEDSTLELTMLTPRRVSANVTGTGEAALAEGGSEVAFAAGGAVAGSKGGRVSLTFDGRTATASALEGNASLTVGDKTVALRAGEFSAARGGTLTRPTKLPSAPSLDVAWPSQTETNKAAVVLKGKVSPYARVLVLGRKVEAGADGAFEAKLSLRRGRQTVTVVAVDPLGRRVVQSRQFVFDADAPSIKGRVEYDR